MGQLLVTHELIKHENSNLELRTSVRLDGTVHNQSTSLYDGYTIVDIKLAMRDNREALAVHVGHQLVGQES